MSEQGRTASMYLTTNQMNGFKSWTGLKRPFHNYCWPLLDHSSAAEWKSMDEGLSQVCGVGRVPFINLRRRRVKDEGVE